jgi:hypothetical protein
VVADQPLLAGAGAAWPHGDAHAVDADDGGAALDRIGVNACHPHRLAARRPAPPP